MKWNRYRESRNAENVQVVCVAVLSISVIGRNFKLVPFVDRNIFIVRSIASPNLWPFLSVTSKRKNPQRSEHSTGTYGVQSYGERPAGHESLGLPSIVNNGLVVLDKLAGGQS